MNSEVYQTGDIYQHYSFDKIIKEKEYSELIRAKKKSNGKEFSIKIIKKNDIPEDELYLVQNEVDILSQIDHPNIVKLYEVWENKLCFFFVLELMVGGDLFDRIIENENYSEKEAVEIIKPIIDALRYLHELGIIHRDIKPENIMYVNGDPMSTVKIADFGCAKINESGLMTTQLGSPIYVAPEVFSGSGYDESVDYWSVGVLLYIMLCGFPPFEDETEKSSSSERKVLQKLEFPSPHWDNISKEAKDLIEMLLNKDPKKRPNGEKILKHSWMCGKAPENDLNSLPEKISKYHLSKRVKVISRFLDKIIENNKLHGKCQQMVKID